MLLLLLLLLLRPVFHASLHLLLRQVFLVGGEVPGMAEGVEQVGGAITVELILQGTFDRRAGGHRLLEQCIDVRDVEADRHRCTLEMLRAEGLPGGRFLGQHDR